MSTQTEQRPLTDEEIRAIREQVAVALRVVDYLQGCKIEYTNSSAKLDRRLAFLTEGLDKLPRLLDEIERLKSELDRAREETPLWEVLENECWDLRSISMPIADTGDADVGWVVIEHHMAEPAEREIGFGHTPLEALRNAMLRQKRGGSSAHSRKSQEDRAREDAWVAFEREVNAWQTKTFPESTLASCLAHLRDELEEIEEAPESADEYADALLLLLSAYRFCEADVDLFTATRAKFDIVKQRKWGDPDERGVVRHVDATPPEQEAQEE